MLLTRHNHNRKDFLKVWLINKLKKEEKKLFISGHWTIIWSLPIEKSLMCVYSILVQLVLKLSIDLRKC